MCSRPRRSGPIGVFVLATTLVGCNTGYPQAHRDEQIDVLHGRHVADPYRWLEDPDTPEARAWIEAQNRLTFRHLERIPQRKALQTRLTELWNYERFRTPWKRGGLYFMYRNDGLQDQDVLYVMSHPDSTPRPLIDPNKFSDDGTIALTSVAVSKDGQYVAYGTSSGGSDWQEWRVRDIDSGNDLEDHLRWVKFSEASWTHDGKGFFYSRFDAPGAGRELQAQNYYQKLYYHRLGTSQDQDLLIYDRPDQREWGFTGQVTDDGKYLVIFVWKGTHRENLIFYKDLSSDGEVVELIDTFKAQHVFIGNDGPKMWFFTDHDAPRGRMVAIDVRSPTEIAEIIPEANDTLESIEVVGEHFVASYLHDAHSRIRVYELSGKPLRDVDLPGIGRVSGFRGRRGDPETFFSFTSFNTPPTVYRYDVASGRVMPFRSPRVAFDPNDYVTEQIFYRSQDGTRVPMFISYRKGLQKNGRTPTLLYGYGGFNIPITPRFSVGNLVWMEMGGIYAVANIRGGGEYGKAWHEAGRRHHKQNVFDDFIGAAEWLIANDYTSSANLGITGRSNGGLLVGACMVQRPDLFAAALPGVGVLDMLRFHKFTIGWAWISDYGSPDDPDDFEVLLSYSPLHNIRAGAAYPATMITTADHDDRVVPAHSFKFAAALQAAQGGPAPVLIRIETRAGHGAGKPTTLRIEEQADTLAFLVEHLGLRPPKRN